LNAAYPSRKGWLLGIGIGLSLVTGIFFALPCLPFIPSTWSFRATPRPTATVFSTPAHISPRSPFVERMALPAPLFTPPALSIASGLHNNILELARFGDGWPAATAFSVSGDRMALGTSIGVQSYDTTTWQITASSPSASPVYVVAYSPDGRWLAAGKLDGNIALLDPATLKPLGTLLSRNSPVRSLGFLHPKSPQSSIWLAAGYQNGTIAVWDLATSSVRLEVGDPLLGYWGYGIRNLAFSRDGEWLVAGGDQGYVSSWRLADGSPGPKLQSQHGLLFGLAFSPDSRFLATACSDGTVQIWDYLNGQPLHKLDGHTYGAWAVAYSPDGASLAVGAGDGSVRIWDPATGSADVTVFVSTRAVDALTYSPDGRFLSAVSFSQSVSILRQKDFQSEERFHTHVRALRSAAFSADQSLAVITAENGIAYLWNLREGWARTLGDEHLASNAGMAAAFSPDDRWLAVGDGGLNLLRIYRTADMTILQELPIRKVRGLAFDPSSRYLAAAGREVVVADLDANALQRFDLTGNATSIAFLASPDGPLRLAAGLDSGVINVWDLSNGNNSELNPDGGEAIWALAGYAGKVAAADNSGLIQMWDVGTGRRLLAITGNAAPELSLAFSPDGTLLAGGGMDGAIFVWNTADGGQQALLRGHTGWVNGLDFASDGKMLISASSDGTARIWGIIAH